MSHCHFENTLFALQECQRALSEDDMSELNQYEKPAMEQLIKLCAEIAEVHHEG